MTAAASPASPPYSKSRSILESILNAARHRISPLLTAPSTQPNPNTPQLSRHRPPAFGVDVRKRRSHQILTPTRNRLAPGATSVRLYAGRSGHLNGVGSLTHALTVPAETLLLWPSPKLLWLWGLMLCHSGLILAAVNATPSYLIDPRHLRLHLSPPHPGPHLEDSHFW